MSDFDIVRLCLMYFFYGMFAGSLTGLLVSTTR